MKIAERIPQSVITAATAMMGPYVPEITPTGLIQALKTYQAEPKPEARQKPYTRDEVADLLGLSLMSIHRLMYEGRLKRIKIGKRAVRITADSVAALLEGRTAIELATESAEGVQA